MGLLNQKNNNHVQYNGDKTTLLDIKRRHIKENQTIYSGSYAIKNKPVQTAITSTVPLWQSQPARSEVERLVYVKNDILRQMMDWVGGDWVGSVDYGKNTIITYDAPDDLKQKTDWNENFDQALADNFGTTLAGFDDIGISIQMLNCICETELSLKSIASDGSELSSTYLHDALYGKLSTGDTSGKNELTYGYGMKYWFSDTEYYSDIPCRGGILVSDLLKKLGKDHWESLAELRPYFLARMKGLRKKVVSWLGSENFSQNVIDALVHRAYSSEGPAAEMAKRLRKGESLQSVHDNWIHLHYCKAKNGGGTGSARGWADGYTRNCEEMRDWFLNGPNDYWKDRTEGSEGVEVAGGTGQGAFGVTVNVGDLKIINKFLSQHITSAPNREIKYLAIHYTAGGSSSPGSAQAIYNVFSSRPASADFAVDDRDIVQFNPDLKKYYCWAIGDTGTGGGPFKGKATNRNTISIEICSNLKKGTSAAAPNHSGWTFTDSSLINALKLAKYLMKKYNIPRDRVIRHYDVTGKYCPGIVGWNDGVLYATTGNVTKDKNNSSCWTKFKNCL
jgi:sulfur relay (sulfurtransferase) DsrC/TusE family protein